MIIFEYQKHRRFPLTKFIFLVIFLLSPKPKQEGEKPQPEIVYPALKLEENVIIERE